jgi:hypothetical protein
MGEPARLGTAATQPATGPTTSSRTDAAAAVRTAAGMGTTARPTATNTIAVGAPPPPRPRPDRPWYRREQIITPLAVVLLVSLLLGLVGLVAKPPTPAANTAALPAASTTTAAPTTAARTTAAPTTTTPPTTAPPATTQPPTTARVVAPTRRPTTSARPPRTTAAPSLCGAPANPYGYNFCGRGGLISNPAPDVCVYFDCIPNFDNGTGYMVECHDAMYSMSGGRQGACSYHDGVWRPVYG